MGASIQGNMMYQSATLGIEFAPVRISLLHGFSVEGCDFRLGQLLEEVEELSIVSSYDMC